MPSSFCRVKKYSNGEKKGTRIKVPSCFYLSAVRVLAAMFFGGAEGGDEGEAKSKARA
jgi:hypothetical protein